MIFRRNKNKTKEEIPEQEDLPVADTDEDEFSATTKPAKVLRKDFHKQAKKKLEEAIAEGEIVVDDTVENDAPEVSDNIPEDSAVDESSKITEAEGSPEDTDVQTVEDAPDSENSPEDNIEETDMAEPEPDTKDEEDTEPVAEEEKEPFKVRAKAFIEKHKKGLMITLIALASVFVAMIGFYIYGCNTLPAHNVMGRNIYIENVDVSNLTYDEALIRVKNTPLLKNCDLTIYSNGRVWVIDGVEAGLTAKIEDTVDRAMRYGKTGNVLIDGLANTLQYIFPHTVLPSATVKEDVIRQELKEFGVHIHGELTEHSFEVGEGYIVCTPGHTGFSGKTDSAFASVIEAINNENFSNIYVSLLSASPQPCTFDMVNDFTYCEPQNAHYQVVNGEVTVIKEAPGRYLNRKEASVLAPKVLEGEGVIYIPYYETDAQIKEGDLKEKLFNAKLGSYQTTYYAGGNRGKNVGIASSKINNAVLLPGEVFSFNDTVGPRSSANGFLPAEEYMNGQSVMGIGGGTCQVATTLYNAVLYSDLSIVSKLNHMFPVGYAPLGQDATVSDSGVDFKFANNTDYPIKLESVTGGGRITITVIGTARPVEHKVKIENITSYVGADRSVRSYRYVYDPDGKQIRKDDLGKSYYMPHP